MKYAGMPLGMWLLFRRSFQRNLTNVLGIDPTSAKEITKKAKAQYKEIIGKLPAFEKGDRFQMNIVSCAMLSSFLLHLRQKPSVDQATKYYNDAMMTPATRWFCRMSGKRKFSEKDVRGIQAAAALRAADRNPYSWNMDYLPYPDGSGYEARFTRCGICTLMRELHLFEYVPAMCRLDYAMSDAGGAARFVRQYTLASGGPYCDCGYKRKEKEAG
ncbi:MAG: L-2-amino-thiazoline-4-carboxylic acid hydrolase [Clostridia bacterium]|nr:L-2-amino-thiazoline-4-carboxylic acid hydrolase [Clostridia bacterium]